MTSGRAVPWSTWTPPRLRGRSRGKFRGEAWTAIKLLLRSGMMLGIFLGQYCISTLTYFFLTWFPVYLVQQRGMSILKAGLVASIPALCGFAGGVLGGVFSDALLRGGVAECVFSGFQTCQKLARLFANANTGQTGGL